MSRVRVGHIYEVQFDRIGPDGSIPWTGHVLVLEDRGRHPICGSWQYDVLVTDDQGDLFTIDDYTFNAPSVKRVT